jgi:glycerol-3-phosphate dehydrogenase subunit B
MSEPGALDDRAQADAVDEVDVLVVGGGAAGATAALRARALGARVMIVSRAGGATSSWSGAVDVADALVGTVPAPRGGTGLAGQTPSDARADRDALDVDLVAGGDDGEVQVLGTRRQDGRDALGRGPPWREAVDSVSAREPRHPYARCTRAWATLPEALAFFSDAVAPLGLVERPDGKNHVLATAAGTVKRAALVPHSQHLDVADLGPGAVLGIVGWSDLAGFDAPVVARMLRYVTSLSAYGPRVVDVVVPRVFSAREPFSHTASLAAHLDEGDHRAELLRALKKQLATMALGPTHLLTPPILSARPVSARLLQEISDHVGCPVRELLSLPPSVPGARLLSVLHETCIARGCVVGGGPARAPSVQGRLVTSVSVGGRRVRTGTVVLAGGRFQGGGIVRDQVAREALLDLPVFVDGALMGDRFVGDFLGTSVGDAHALFRAGIDFDEALRPLGSDHRAAFDNVVAAGTTLGGFDPARDGSALAVSVWTGFLAGQLAVARP